MMNTSSSLIRSNTFVVDGEDGEDGEEDEVFAIVDVLCFFIFEI